MPQDRKKKQGKRDLNEREHTDEQGNVHHHTETFEEEHREGEKRERRK